MKKLAKRGLGFFDLPMYAIYFVIISITLSVGSSVVQDNRDDQTADSFSYNASNFGLQGINKLAKYQPQFGNVIALAVIIAVLFLAFSSIRG